MLCFVKYSLKNMREGSASMISLHAYGLTRFAEPTSTAVAPAIIISITLSAVDTPPHPIIGMFTAEATCQIILTATGKIARPEKPPTLLATTGRRVLVSILMPSNVFIRHRPSAPASSAAQAIFTISVTFGVSLTYSGLVTTSFTAFTTSATDSG